MVSVRVRKHVFFSINHSHFIVYFILYYKPVYSEFLLTVTTFHITHSITVQQNNDFDRSTALAHLSQLQHVRHNPTSLGAL